MYFYSELHESFPGILFEYYDSGISRTKMARKLAHIARPTYILIDALKSDAYYTFLRKGTSENLNISKDFEDKLHTMAEILDDRFTLSLQSEGVHFALPDLTLLDEFIVFRRVDDFVSIHKVFAILQLFDDLHDLLEEGAVKLT